MKQLLCAACLLFALPISQGQDLLSLAGSPPASSLASFPDDFNRSDSDSLGGNWTEIAQDVDIASNEASAPSTFGFEERAAVYTGTTCATVTQYIKVTLGGPTTGAGGGVILRNTASGAFYQVQFDDDDDIAIWKYFPTAGGTEVTIGTGAMTIVYPFTVGVIVTGTGNSTEIRVWNNPTANAPTSSSSWDGGAATVTLTDNPATAVDTGSRLGIGISNTSNGTAATWENFYGGDVP